MKHILQLFFLRLAMASLVAAVFHGPLQAQSLRRVEQADFGRTQDGASVKLITLRNSKGMSAQIITYGAIIKEIRAPDRNGNFTNIVLTTGEAFAVLRNLYNNPPGQTGSRSIQKGVCRERLEGLRA